MTSASVEEKTYFCTVVYFSPVAARKKKVSPSPSSVPPATLWERHQSSIVNGVVGAVALIVVSLMVAIFGGYVDHRTDARIDAKVGPINQRLEQLQSSVSEIQGELKRIASRHPSVDRQPVRTIENAAAVSPGQLATTLTALRTAVNLAKETGERPPDQALAIIQSKLLNVDASSPGYWPLVFDLVSYRSILITGVTSPPSPKLNVLNGLHLHGGPSAIVKGGAERLEGSIEGVTFVDAWIEFDARTPVTLKNVHFDHCVLIFRGFDTINAPSPQMQQLGRELLVSNVANFRVRG